MIIPTLNLLPPERRHQFEQLLLFSALRRMLIIIGVTIAVASVALAGAKFLLSRELQRQHNATILAQERVTAIGGGSLDQQIRQFNVQLSTVSNLQKEAQPWTQMLHDFFGTVPAGIRLTQIDIDGKQKTITVRGMADLRDDLLAWQQRIAASQRFQNPTTPISNLLQREHIAFELEMKFLQP